MSEESRTHRQFYREHNRASGRRKVTVTGPMVAALLGEEQWQTAEKKIETFIVDATDMSAMQELIVSAYENGWFFRSVPIKPEGSTDFGQQLEENLARPAGTAGRWLDVQLQLPNLRSYVAARIRPLGRCETNAAPMYPVVRSAGNFEVSPNLNFIYADETGYSLGAFTIPQNYAIDYPIDNMRASER